MLDFDDIVNDIHVGQVLSNSSALGEICHMSSTLTLTLGSIHKYRYKEHYRDGMSKYITSNLAMEYGGQKQ